MKKDILLSTDITNRIYGLDILRAIAILLVLIQHTPFSFSNKILISFKDFFLIDGVSIFFVLSGYLIGRILFKTLYKNKIHIKTIFYFWLNRWLRTIPPYYFVLIILFIISNKYQVDVQSYFLSFLQKLSYIFFLQNFSTPHLGFFAESWSLSVEEWFYILTPILIFIFILIFRVKLKTSIVFTIIALFIIPLVYRFYNFYTFGSNGIIYDLFFRKLVVTRLDSIACGVLAAYIYFFYNKKWNNKNKFILFGIGLFIIFIDHLINITNQDNFYVKFYCCTFSFPIMSLGIMMLLPYLTKVKRTSGYIYRIITFISLISYSLYLLHFSLIYYCIIVPLQHTFTIPQCFIVPLYWLITFTLSTLMYKYIEQPFMNLRRFLNP